MRRILLLSLVVLNSSFLLASSLDDAAISLARGEVSEEAIKGNFSKVDFELILEKYRSMKLEKAKREGEQQKVNELLKKRNTELEQEIKKIKATNSTKKIKRITLEEAITNTYRGIYGDNPERAKKLRNLGFTSQDIKRIQDGVNQLVEKEKNKEKE